MEDAKSESVLEYRMEQVEKKLDQVERKLDKVTDLLLQTAEQEQRIKTLESAINEIKDSNKKNIDRWLSPLISALVSGIVAFIFVINQVHKTRTFFIFNKVTHRNTVLEIIHKQDVLLYKVCIFKVS